MPLLFPRPDLDTTSLSSWFSARPILSFKDNDPGQERYRQWLIAIKKRKARHRKKR